MSAAVYIRHKKANIDRLHCFGKLAQLPAKFRNVVNSEFSQYGMGGKTNGAFGCFCLFDIVFMPVPDKRVRNAVARLRGEALLKHGKTASAVTEHGVSLLGSFIGTQFCG